MFGLGTLFTRSTSKDTVKSSVSSPSPIMIGDFVGTYSNDNPTITPTSLLYSSPSGIITLELLQNYNNKNFQLDKIYNNGIIGKCDGEFPVTNPVKNNVYYYSVDKKYYRCKNGSTSVINTPDDNFEEISLYNLSLNGTGGSSISSIEITGDVNGTGILDDSSDVINIVSSLSNMSEYNKASYSAITTSDTPITAIAKLEGGLDNKANTSGSYPNLTVGTANKVLNSLTLSLNGESQTAFNGNAAVMIDITAEKIGAATTNHDHSGVYQPVGNYSVVGHKHTKSEISDMPTTLPNPNTLSIQLNGGTANVYDGSSAKTLNITPASIGAQVAGSYALSNHNHNGVYAAASHSHDLISGTYTGSGGIQQPSYIPSGKVRFNMMNNVINGDRGYKDWILMDTYSGSDVPYVTAFGITKGSSIRAYLMQGAKNGKAWDRTAEIWHSANFNPATKLNTSGGTISGALTVTGQILSNADVVAYSDARFKTNLQVIDNPINKILSINGYKYDMLGVDNSRQVGVIAQEIEQILPEAVFEDQNGHLGVRYTNLIPLLIEGFKQQQKEIQLLKRQLGMEV